MKNLKKIYNEMFFEEIFQDVINDEIKNGNFYKNKLNDISVIQYYKNEYLKLCLSKKYNFLKKEWLYKQFDTKNLKYQPDKWILLGVELIDNEINTVWWDYRFKQLFKNYPIDAFKIDIQNKIYIIKKIKN